MCVNPFQTENFDLRFGIMFQESFFSFDMTEQPHSSSLLSLIIIYLNHNTFPWNSPQFWPIHLFQTQIWWYKHVNHIWWILQLLQGSLIGFNLILSSYKFPFKFTIKSKQNGRKKLSTPLRYLNYSYWYFRYFECTCIITDFILLLSDSTCLTSYTCTWIYADSCIEENYASH